MEQGMKQSLAGLLCILVLLHLTRTGFHVTIVGYLNKRFAPRDHLFARQLSDGTNTLNPLFARGLGRGPEEMTVASEQPIGSGWSIASFPGFGSLPG